MGQKIEALHPYTRALLKSHLISAGYSYDELNKPIIGIANSWNEFNHGHLPQKVLVEKIKAGVISAGGVPVEFHTVGPCDGLAVGNTGMHYILPMREIIADSIEATVNGHPIFDGLVLLSSCDKITPGMLMAAARLRMPAIHISAGPAIPSISFAWSKELRKKFLHGEISERELAESNSELYSTCGNCPYIGTANTMNCVAEGLGMALPGSALVPAHSHRRMEYAFDTGKSIVNLVRRELSCDKIMTHDAFENAIRVAAAIGGSSNYILHIPAIASELCLKISLEKIDSINASTPLLCKIAPNGPLSVIDLDAAGGVPTVLKELGEILKLDSHSVSGSTIREIIAKSQPGDGKVIRKFSNPYDAEGGIVVLRGNLAPEGAVVKRSAVPRDLYSYSGQARVFTSEGDCIDALEQKQVSEGDVLVVTNEGPRGGPGMREMHRLTGVLRAFSDNIALVTDGRFSGADSGLVIGYVSPEAAVGGPIAAIQDGDRIKIDLNNRKLEVNISNEEMGKRLTDFSPLKKRLDSPMLNRYAFFVNSASKGAILKSNSS
jgi:dihydroxy-acid dehydratase